MKSYNFSADVVRTIAIIGVVLIHTANAVFGRPDYVGGISWWFAILLNSISRISIPLFIMISGYFLLGKDETYPQTIKRTITRIVIPLLFWFLAMVIWNGQLHTPLLTRILTVNVFDLYFLLILLGLYLIAPLLRSYLKNAIYSAQKYVTVLLLLLGCVMFLSDYLLYLCQPTNAFTYWLPYTGLFVAGYFLGNNSNLFSTGKLLTIYILSLCVTVSMSYVYFYFYNQGNTILNPHGCLTYYSDSYLSINVVLMALSAFILLMRLSYRGVPQWLQKLVYSVARNTLGIYVLHIFILEILDTRMHVFDKILPLWLYVIVKFFVIFTLSFGASWIFMNVPYLSLIFGEKKKRIT